MSDPRFFRKYLDMLDEEDPPEMLPDPNAPREQPHPIARAVGAARVFNNLKNINADTVKNAAAQELSNVARSATDPSSKNVSIINRLFGTNKD
jgi:hypothetical protein